MYMAKMSIPLLSCVHQLLYMYAYAAPDALTLIFVETKRGCDALDDFLYAQVTAGSHVTYNMNVYM